MSTTKSASVLIAGIGNIFLGDDGFGVETIARLHEQHLPHWVQVADYGISGMHLAYELVGGYEMTILIDATPRGGAPGTVYLLEAQQAAQAESNPIPDAHGMQPDVVLRMLDLLGGEAGRVLIVGCEPETTEHGMGLSAAVTGALDEAVRIVTDLAWGENTNESSVAVRMEV